MPKFATPQPISVTLELVLGPTRITASDRADTVVEIRPTDPGSDLDVKAAEQARVDFADGKLVVRAHRPRGLFAKAGSVDITVELPEGSDVRVDTSVGDLVVEGRVGECRSKSATGDVRVTEAAATHVRTSMGNIDVTRTTGRTDLSTGSGNVDLGLVEGDAVVKNSNGQTRIGEVTGELRANAANGDITVHRAHRDVHAKTANGGIHLADVTRGEVTMETAAGRLEVGIAHGSAAWLDVRSAFGAVRNELQPSEGPGSDETVRVHARTSYGDIVIRRAN
jgi:DUF4097 and DUF4098 domain-containing protein YvlB